jgi:hypothetical protein
MTWINVSRIVFPSRSIMLTLSHYDMVNLDLTWLLIRRDREFTTTEELTKIEEAIRILIENERQEFSGCIIHSMDYDISRALWRIVIDHPSLDIVEPYCVVRDMPLLREPRQHSRRIDELTEMMLGRDSSSSRFVPES